MILILFLIGLGLCSVLPGTGECTVYTSLSECQNSGYCKWTGVQCTLYTSSDDCYRIDERGACTIGGKYETICQPLDTVAIEYVNVCGITTKIDYNFVRFAKVTTGNPSYSISGLKVDQLKVATPQMNFLYQVLTVNIQIASNKELQDILDLYKVYGPTFLSGTVHPYYLEKCLFQTLQNVRDDLNVLSNAEKTNTITKFWDIIQIYHQKMAIYSKHYQTNYYFLNFAQTTFSRLFISIEGQDHTTSLTWVKYQRNGFIQAVSYTPIFFGITDALTDVIYVNVIAEDGTPFVQIENMEIIYTQTSSNSLTSVARNLKFINDKTQVPHTISNTITSPPCDQNEKTQMNNQFMSALIFFFFILTLNAQTYVGQYTCLGLAQIDCGKDEIYGKGWCYWDSTLSTCANLPCYLIDEVASCRTGGSLQTGGANSECDSLETFSLQYDNVCCDKNLGKLNYAFVRFTMNFDGFVDKTSDSISMGSLVVTTSVKDMFKLYTINPWHLSKEPVLADFQTKLIAILDKYLEPVTRQELIDQSRSHPFYLERTVYQALQLLRDRTVLYKSPVTLRDAILPKIWSLALVALTRMTKFQPNYYQTNYYFINFAIIPYFRNALKISGQMHSVNIDWSTYIPSSNGFVMVYTYPPEQFGIIKAFSDVICIRPFLGNTVSYVTTEDNYDNLFYPLKFEYYWSDTSLTINQADVKLFTISNDAKTITDTGATFICTQASRICTISTNYAPSPAPSDGKGQNYFIGRAGYNTLSDLKRAQCILAYKTWGGSCA